MPRVADYQLDELKLDVPERTSVDVALGASITRADLDLTIDGASTITLDVEDPHGRLLRSDTLSRWAWGSEDVGDDQVWVRRGRAVDVKLDGLAFRLAKTEKRGTTIILTLEERIVQHLRRHKGARKVARSKMTRAQFVGLLASEVKADGGAPVFIPELKVRQPIAKAKDRVSTAERKASAEPGLERTGLTVKGNAMTTSQARIAERVLDVARSLKSPPKATLALVCACIVESLLKDLSGGDRDSVGVLQVRAALHGKDATSVESSAHRFLVNGFAGAGGAMSLARKHADWTAGRIAQACQASAYPDRYDEVRDEARKIIAAYGGGSGDVTPSSTYFERYEYERQTDETSWDAMGRLATEVEWRRFAREGRLWYVSDDYLFSQASALRVAEGRRGVEVIDWELDPTARIPVAEVTVTARADRWTVLPGQLVTVEDQGPASGRWIVHSIRGDLLDSSREVTVTLRKPVPKLPEPRSQEATRNEAEEDVLLAGGGAAKAYAKAKVISEAGPPYVYGGGHGGTLKDTRSTQGLDCSSSTSLALFRAGMFDGKGAIVSGEFASSWGKPGEGKQMTVWANAEHVWIEFNLPEAGGYSRFDTSPHGDGGRGARIRRSKRPTDGFTPRHWPGT